MIKLKKIAAIALAATMCMGLSMTAFAVENGGSNSAGAGSSDMVGLASPTFVDGVADTRQTDGKGTVNSDLELNDDPLNKKSETYKSIDTTNEVVDILAENGLGVPKGATVVPISMRNITGLSESSDNVITFTLSSAEFSKNKNDYDETRFHEGDTIYAMMETGENTGVWEMVPGTINADGDVDFTVDHTGTIILVKAMKNGKLVQFTKNSNGDDVKPPVIIDPDDPQNPVVPTPDEPGTSTNPGNGQNANGSANGSANATGSVWTSPKTGEF